MATNVYMEALSPTREEGKLVNWLKNEGDAVKTGDPIGEVETDKAIMELVARGDGVLRKRLINEGDAVPVGTLVGVIAAADENIDSMLGDKAVVPPSAATKPDAPNSEIAEAAKAPAPAPPAAAAPPSPAPSAPTATAAALAPSAPQGPTRSSPLARRLASERGLDLGSVQGSGPNGRIIKRDIEAAASPP